METISSEDSEDVIYNIRQCIDNLEACKRRIDKIFHEEVQYCLTHDIAFRMEEVTKDFSIAFSELKRLSLQLSDLVNSIDETKDSNFLALINLGHESDLFVQIKNQRCYKEICFYINAELADELDHRAKSAFISKQKIVNMILEDALQKETTSHFQRLPKGSKDNPKSQVVVRIHYPIYEQMKDRCAQTGESYSIILENALHAIWGKNT